MSARNHQYSAMGNMFPVIVIVLSCVAAIVYGSYAGWVVSHVNWTQVNGFKLDQRPTVDLAGWFDHYRGNTVELAQAPARRRGATPRTEYVPRNPQNKVFVQMPVEGRMTSDWGWRSDPFTKKQKWHSGNDFGCRLGDPIYAPGEGRVTRAGPKSGYGNYTVEINHGWGFDTLYGHMSGMTVHVGQVVEPGTRIGTCGSEGRSTGPHLHFTVWKDGKQVDPQSVLPK